MRGQNYLNLPQVDQQIQRFERNEFAMQEAQKASQRTDQEWDDEQQLKNTRSMYGVTKVLMDTLQNDPDSFPMAYKELSEKGVREGWADPNNLPPVESITLDDLESLNTAAKAGLRGRPTNEQLSTRSRQESVPAKIQQAEWWLAAPEEAREGYMRANYAGKVTKVNGVNTWVFPGGEQIPLSDVDTEAQSQAQIAGTVKSAQEEAVTDEVVPRGEEERRVALTNSAPGAHRAVNYAVSELDRFTQTAKELRNHPGLSKATGFGGEQLSAVPGTDAADAVAIMENLKSKAFISALSAMRAASKTGGAVGNVSDAEGGRFENAFVALQQAQSYEQFIAQLDKLIGLNAETKGMLTDAYNTEYQGIESAPAFEVAQGAQEAQVGPAPEGTIIRSRTGQQVIKQNGRWVPLGAGEN